MNDLANQAIQLALETTSSTLALEEENAKRKEELAKNISLLEDFDVAAPRAALLQKTLQQKREELENKRKELAQVQDALIHNLTNPDKGQKNNTESFQALPIVLNRVHKFVTDVTEEAVDKKALQVSLIEIVKLNETLQAFYDKLVQMNLIQESDEEKTKRQQNFYQNQQVIVQSLQNVLSIHKRIAEEEEEKGEPAPKVEEVTPEQTAAEPQTDATKTE